jgi:hypothetical protein
MVNELDGLLGHYVASCGICLPTFQENVSVPSSRVKSPSRKESQPITSINNYHVMPRNTPEDHRFHQHRGRTLKSRKSMVNFCVCSVLKTSSLKVHHGTISSAAVLRFIRCFYDISDVTEILFTTNKMHFLFTFIFSLFECINFCVMGFLHNPYEKIYKILILNTEAYYKYQFLKRTIIL